MKIAKVIEEKSVHFKNYKYNIIPLNFPGSSEAIVELHEVSYNSSHLCLTTCSHYFYLYIKPFINDGILDVNDIDKRCYWCAK